MKLQLNLIELSIAYLNLAYKSLQIRLKLKKEKSNSNFFKCVRKKIHVIFSLEFLKILKI